MKSFHCFLFAIAIASVSLFFSIDTARAHCQVPCGIYDDAARIAEMKEDAVTIAKAIGKIQELAAKTDATSVNQRTRWVMTKETHASNIISIVSEYFLTQKVKPVAADAKGYSDYLSALAVHHMVLTAAMKTKQDPSEEMAKKLTTAINKLAEHY